MTIVNPLATSHLVVQSTLPAGRPEERQNELRMDQVVRATVVEGGLDKALLDLNHQRFHIQTGQELHPGQQLDLQVLSTHPQLTFKLLGSSLESRLASLFPLLTKSFDWNSLVVQLQGSSAPQPEALKLVLKQLGAFLTPAPALARAEIRELGDSLAVLSRTEALFSGSKGASLACSLEALQVFLGQQQDVDEGDLPASPRLLGLLKDFVTQLSGAAHEKPNWPPLLAHQVEQLLSLLQPLVQEPELLTAGRNLGVLAQLLGLNLETELLHGRNREALSSLKLALLGKADELAPQEQEALHRLELFQVCRAKLGEQNQLFIPLPLPFVEEGFLLVDQDRDPTPREPGAQEETRVALHLRMSALGNLHIDMLADAEGLLLRVRCEDQPRADFLAAMAAELKEQLQSVPLRGVSFAVGAESPARELLKKLLPEAKGLLDARV